jgi:hypothetical protein
MASERQIAANRQNARRSSGPRSSAGKRRSSGNALRHGLSRVTNDRGGADIEALARLLVGANEDEETPELARDAVRAHLDLLRIRAVKRDLMERVYSLGMVDPPPRFHFRSADIRYLMSQPLDRPLRWPQRVNPSGPMPSGRDERAEKPCGAPCQTSLSSIAMRDGLSRRNSRLWAGSRPLRSSERILATKAIELRTDERAGGQRVNRIQS